MKSIILSTIFALVLIFGAVLLSRNSNSGSDAIVDNVKVVDGVQVIEISAKGGYSPRKSVAKSGIPTVLRIDTNGTFDCSAIVRIPSLNITKNLPQSGVTDIDLGTSTIGKLNGSCGMGMYPFEVLFQ